MSLREEIATTMNRLHNYSDDALETADAILALPEMKEMALKASTLDGLWKQGDLSPDQTIRDWKEKAEKWDSHSEDHIRYVAEATKYEKQLRLILSGLEVEERCDNECHRYFGDRFLPPCPKCGKLEGSGTGTITRQATPEEVREFVEWGFHSSDMSRMDFFYGMMDAPIKNRYFKLASGAILRMKNA